ncbi:hypothetical protein N7466_008211 [Penicillium verhagenii]|uniref:uncharacterized protein n=1 Tax=Penicillium verhagenii TaxID=1562060 RepID=UPI0025457958|nr:uncharacterized protein N7466_008211 [Penicillium verhagenii]KAJ5924024.1 hypothetical protein N7466_008211 [Penicillium verhagenii]
MPKSKHVFLLSLAEGYHKIDEQSDKSANLKSDEPHLDVTMEAKDECHWVGWSDRGENELYDT